MTRATARRRRTASALMALALAGGTLTAALTAAPAAHADTWRDKEYWLAESGITKAWEVSKGADVKVAVIDSGVDGGHPGLPGGGYAEWAGTSGATPIVAGVAALIRSRWPEMTAHQVIHRIVSTAKDAGAPGKDPLYGFGILDAEAALKADVPGTRVNPLGSISDWIRVHRRGILPTSPAAPSAVPSSAAPTLPEATVPVAAPPSELDAAVPALVVLGFGGLLLCIVAAAVVQLRRAMRPGPPEGPEAASTPDTGALDSADSSGKP